MSRTAAGCATALITVMLAGCSTHRQLPSASVSPGAVATAPTAAGSPTGPAPPKELTESRNLAAPTGPGTVAACTHNDLSLAQLPGSDGAGGTVIVAIGLHNISSHACTLEGYPSFTLVGRTAGSTGDTEEPVTVQRGGPGPPGFALPARQTVVPPAGKAGFLLAYANRPNSGGASCAQATAMRLAADMGTATGPVNLSVCGQPIRVSPYLPDNQLTLGE
jgi:hypothetical protein